MSRVKGEIVRIVKRDSPLIRYETRLVHVTRDACIRHMTHPHSTAPKSGA